MARLSAESTGFLFFGQSIRGMGEYLTRFSYCNEIPVMAVGRFSTGGQLG